VLIVQPTVMLRLLPKQNVKRQQMNYWDTAARVFTQQQVHFIHKDALIALRFEEYIGILVHPVQNNVPMTKNVCVKRDYQRVNK
jgi:hypothetical protein